MLSEKATKLTMGLCDKIGSKEYVIYSWEDVAKAYGEDIDVSEIKELFEDVRLNQCINQKYKDDEEVCFAITDKALLIKQDYEALTKVEENAAPLVKTDESGNSVIVIPKSAQQLQSITKQPKKLSVKLTAFLYGILGGAVGGAVIYGIIYLLGLIGA